MAHEIIATTAEGEEVARLYYGSGARAYSAAIYELLDRAESNKGESGDGSYNSIPIEIFQKAIHTMNKQYFDVFDYVSDSYETRKRYKELKRFLKACLKSAKKGKLIIVSFN